MVCQQSAGTPASDEVTDVSPVAAGRQQVVYSLLACHLLGRASNVTSVTKFMNLVVYYTYINSGLRFDFICQYASGVFYVSALGVI